MQMYSLSFVPPHTGGATQEAIQLMCVKASVFSVVVRSMQSLRGDWTMVKNSLHFPAWHEPGGICWMCMCTKEGTHDFSATAV